MTNKVPEYAVKARIAFEALLSKNRNAIRELIKHKGSSGAFKLDTVKALREHAHVKPEASILAQLLVDTTPDAFVDAEGLSPASMTGQNPVGDLRRLAPSQVGKLRAAVVQAALEEQQNTDKTFLVGSTFNAVKLEESLDSWLYSGQYRGAGLDESPLSQISKIMDKQGMNGEELMATRFGILIPVIVAIHIWRILEEYPEDQAMKVGWCDDLVDTDTSDDISTLLR